MLPSETRMPAMNSLAEPAKQQPEPVTARPFVARMRPVLVVLIIIAAACYALTLKDNFTYTDEAEYYAIASNLLHHHRYSLDSVHPTAYRPPGYPAVLVPILAIHNSVRFAKAFNLIFWIAAALVTAHIAASLYGPLAASLALALVLLYPVSLYTAGTLYPQALTSFLFLASIALHFRPQARSSLSEAFFQGLIFSTLILCVPLYTANLLVFLTFETLRERKGALKAIATGAVVAIALGAWGLRNYATYGKFLFASNSGINLLLGNSALTEPNSGTNIDVAAIAPQAANLPELQRDAVLKKDAFDWIKNHPRQWAFLFSEKLANWFNYRNQLATSSESSRIRDIVMALTYYPILALAVVLPMRNKRLSELEYYLLLSYGSAALAYAFFFTRIRFRVPFDYLLLILASGSLRMLLPGFNSRPIQREAPTVASTI